MSGRILTLADVCCAIAEGHIAAAVEGSVYQVNAFELRRYLNTLHPLPPLPSLTNAIAEPTHRASEEPLSSPESSSWSSSIQTSVA